MRRRSGKNGNWGETETYRRGNTGSKGRKNERRSIEGRTQERNKTEGREDWDAMLRVGRKSRRMKRRMRVWSRLNTGEETGSSRRALKKSRKKRRKDGREKVETSSEEE